MPPIEQTGTMTEHDRFEQFMRKYQNMVFSAAMRLLASEAEAKDIAQEVFLKAYQRFGELEESPTAGGWLKTVTTNLCLNHLSRYKARWKFFSEFFKEDTEEELIFDIAAPEATHAEMDEQDQRHILETALLKLPPGQRVPLVLYHFEGKSYEEISATLKVSLSKVKTDIFRGRDALRKKLSGSRAGEEIIPGKPHERQNGPGQTFRLRLDFPGLNVFQQIYG